MVTHKSFIYCTGHAPVWEGQDELYRHFRDRAARREARRQPGQSRGLGAHRARQQDDGVHRPQRRHLPQTPAACHQQGGVPGGGSLPLPQKRRFAGGGGRGRPRGGGGRRTRGQRHLSFSHRGLPAGLSFAEEISQHGVSAHHTPPPREDEHLQRDAAREEQGEFRAAPLFPGEGIHLYPHPHHHGQRLRGRGGDLPRDHQRL